MNPMETHGAVSWIEHSGPDAHKAKAFYETVLGWSVAETATPAGQYQTIILGEKPIGGFSPQPGNEGWRVYVTVDDVDVRLALAKENKAQIVLDAMTVPGVGRMATIEDPFGAKICLIDYSKA